MADDVDTFDEGVKEVADDQRETPGPVSRFVARQQWQPTGMRRGLAISLCACVTLAALVGWLGYQSYEGHKDHEQQEAFVQLARQVALNLSTIDYAEAEADVDRILDSATGMFHDEFAQRAPAFVQVVRDAQSRSVGTVTEAGLESRQGDRAQVIVSVTVQTSTAVAAEAEPRGWRMRIVVEKVGDAIKASAVSFVP